MTAYRKVATVLRTHGYQGSVRIKPEKGFDPAVEAFFVSTPEGSHLPYFVERVEDAGNGTWLIKFDDLESREEASRWSGRELFLPGEEPKDPMLALMGFEVVTESHGPIGRITELTEYPMQMMATITLGERSIQLPLHDDLLAEVDVNKKRVHLNPADGLLDILLDS